MLKDIENFGMELDEIEEIDAETEYEYIIDYEDEREEMEAIDEFDLIMDLEARELARKAEEERLRQLIAVT